MEEKYTIVLCVNASLEPERLKQALETAVKEVLAGVANMGKEANVLGQSEDGDQYEFDVFPLSEPPTQATKYYYLGQVFINPK